MKKANSLSTKAFDPSKSIKRAKEIRKSSSSWTLQLRGKKYVWATQMDRVTLIRSGLPYESIEIISKRINLPIKQLLQVFDVPQTTYNKKLREKSLMNGRDSETILFLTELIDFALNVFNKEEDKFQRWLKKNNASLGGSTPESLLDSITGIQEVKNCLNRLEYGNLA